MDALRDDADTTFDLPSFQDFAGLKGSAFRESIETLEEMANREPDFEPFHDDIGTYVPSVHPSDTLFGSEPRENGRSYSYCYRAERKGSSQVVCIRVENFARSCLQ